MSLKSLQLEIGWIGEGVRQRREGAFFASWTRLLARELETWCAIFRTPNLSKMEKDACRIKLASDAKIVSICHEILNPPIRDPLTDEEAQVRGQKALLAVLMSGTVGISDRNRTRWPAEASEVVWALRVANGTVNNNLIVSLSRAAWQRHLFSEASALANHDRGETNG